uniref:Uncharacterized protein n=1 Tax=Timema shepardi TaxID=629360 RepID=A0A7R9G1S3_TIMSH|nr:unnamed protein product [Timema shepardi]
MDIPVGTAQTPEVGYIPLQKMDIHVGTAQTPEVGYIPLQKMDIHVGIAQTPEVGHILLQKMDIPVGTAQTPEVGYILLQKMDIHVGTMEAPEVGHILLQKMDIHVGTAQTPEVGYIPLEGTEIHVRTAEAPVGYILLERTEIHVETMDTPEVGHILLAKMEIHLANTLVVLSSTAEDGEIEVRISVDKWIYQRFVIELQPEHQQRDMAYVITAGQKIGAKLFVRKIEECDPEGNNGKCINGGVLSKDSNECICPPGFRGFFCEDGCGVNKYGDDCGGKCSSFRRGCKGLVMCKEKIGCDCAPGFQGQLCDTRKCYTSETLMLTKAPPVIQGTMGSAANKHVDTAQESCAIPLAEAVSQGVRTAISHPFVSIVTVPSRSLPSHFYPDGRGGVVMRSFVVPKPAATTASREEGGNSGDFVVLEIWLASEQGNFELTMLIKYKYLSTAPIAEPVSADTIQVYFSVDHTQGRGSPRFYKLQHKYDQQLRWCPLTNFEVYLRDGWRWVLSKRTHESMANFSDVLPGREHKVKLRAMTVNGPASFSKTLSIITSDQVPEAVLDVYQDSVQKDRIRIVWREPRFTAGNIRHYVVTYKCQSLVACPSEDCSYSAGELEIETNYAELKGLLPHAQYIVSVSAVSGFKGPTSTIHAATDHTGAVEY